jgi:hypothetical protein
VRAAAPPLYARILFLLAAIVMSCLALRYGYAQYARARFIQPGAQGIARNAVVTCSTPPWMYQPSPEVTLAPVDADVVIDMLKKAPTQLPSRGWSSGQITVKGRIYYLMCPGPIYRNLAPISIAIDEHEKALVWDSPDAIRVIRAALLECEKAGDDNHARRENELHRPLGN